ncbi:MAG TPA: response regulator [Burkholderiales bacterium]|nr:response regulator [Burkholderiales bacterium]
MSEKTPLVTDDDFYALTPRGAAEIQGARTTLSSLALELLVRMDGTTSVAQLRAGRPATPFDEIACTLSILLRDKFICYATPSGTDALEFDGLRGIGQSPARYARCAKASYDADAGLKSLERHGYFVRIARRPATRPMLPKDRPPRALVVEDELHLAKFLKHFLGFEGFEVRLAGDREAIAHALIEPPAPDLVLLDVVLPDANGFNVLQRIRRDENLHTVPVMMLTAETTRQSVIKGLACGADGYITKPFHTDILVNAIQTMFGLRHGRICPWAYI